MNHQLSNSVGQVFANSYGNAMGNFTRECPHTVNLCTALALLIPLVLYATGEAKHVGDEIKGLFA